MVMDHLVQYLMREITFYRIQFISFLKSLNLSIEHIRGNFCYRYLHTYNVRLLHHLDNYTHMCNIHEIHEIIMKSPQCGRKLIRNFK